MADDMDDTPPPLPSSLPPLLETNNTGRKRNASKKFLDLQAQMSRSKTMYSTSVGKDQSSPLVHPKPSVKLKRGAGDSNLEDSVDFQKSPSQSQGLVHRTLERPKRKGIRTPTRGSRNMLSDLPKKTAINGAIPTGTLVSVPPDYDQPPPLPASAPPPVAALTGDNERKLVEEITGNILTEPPSLPSNDPPSLYNKSSTLDFPPPPPPLDKPPSLSDSPPLPSSLDDQPPPLSSNELAYSESPVLNHTSFLQEPVSLYNKLPPSDKSPITNMPPPADELPPLPPTSDLPSLEKPPTGLIHSVPHSLDQPSVEDSSIDMTDSSSFEAPPPLPSSLPPEIHKSTGLPAIGDAPIMTAGISEPPITQSFTSGDSLLNYVTTQERTPSPLAANSDSLNTSGGIKSGGQSINSSFAISPRTSTAVEATKPTGESPSVSKFRNRIARLKQKRESINPSPALSEKVTDNSRVTSPLLSSYSTPFLEETSNKPLSRKLHTDHSPANISPLLSSTEELNTPVTFSTTNKSATIPRTATAAGSKVVEPTFTVRKISSSRITSGTASISKEESRPSNPPDNISTVDSHLDSAFTKQWEFNADTNIVASGFEDDNGGSEDNFDGSPPPIPSSLPPGAFESDSFLGEVVSNNVSLPPPPPPPVLPAAIADTVSEKNMMAPPLPTSPVPFEIPTSSSSALPLVEPFKPLKEPVITAQEGAANELHDLSTPVKFSENVINNVSKPSASTAHKVTSVDSTELAASSIHKTGLHTAGFANYSPRTARPFSQYYAKDSDSSLQQSDSKDNRHSVHIDAELDIRSRSNSLPMFVCEQLVTDKKAMKPSKKSSSKLKLPWQKRLVPDRSNSMSSDRPKHNSKKEYSDSWRHSSADVKGGTSGSDLMIAQHRNVGSLQQAAGQPLTSSSTDDLRSSHRLIGSDNSVSTSYSELYNSRLLPPPVQFTASETSIHYITITYIFTHSSYL